MVQVLVDHRRVICSKTVFLQLWLDHVDARRKSFQVYVNLYLQELSSMPSTAHSRFSSLAWGCVFDPSSPKDLFLPSQGFGQSMCALSLHGVCKSWTSGHLPLTLGFMTSARIASSLLHAAQV